MSLRNTWSLNLGWNLWIVLVLLVVAVVLGLLNNLRVYEEQRVPWWGAVAQRDDAGHE